MLTALLLVTVFTALCATAEAATPQSCSAANFSAPFCILITPSTSGSCFCRPCSVTPDDFYQGHCNCPLDHFCSNEATESENTPRGYCVPYTLLGNTCSSDTDCQTMAVTVGGQMTINENTYCVGGRCSLCEGSASPIFAAARQCPGWSNGALQSASPGIFRQCTAQGTLITTGSLDYTLGLSSPSSSPTSSLPAGASASRTPSGSRSATPSLSVGASPSTTPSLGANGDTNGQTTTSSGANLPLYNRWVVCGLAVVTFVLGM
jgi:hypothetical protein